MHQRLSWLLFLRKTGNLGENCNLKNYHNTNYYLAREIAQEKENRYSEQNPLSLAKHKNTPLPPRIYRTDGPETAGDRYKAEIPEPIVFQ